MNIEYLIQLLNNKLTVLNNARIQAFTSGDLPTLNALDEEILGTKNTLSQLTLLLSINNAAISTNTTSSEFVATAIDAVQNQPASVQGPSASAIVNGFDISAYATDPSHEQTIQAIVNALPAFSTPADIDTYIKMLAPDSPVTGDMIMNSGTRYSVDIPLLVAIMQNDSLFGTLGIGAKTNNPGNVGNDGTNTRTYPSWDAGVEAVADWLNNHRTSTNPVQISPVVNTTPATNVDTTNQTNTDATVAPTEPVITPPPADSAVNTDSTDQPVNSSNPVISKATRKTKRALS